MKRSKSKPRRLKRRILVVCEDKTEQRYFQEVKSDESYKKALTAAKVIIVNARQSSPDRVVKEAIQKQKAAKKELNPFDKVWVVFDHDHDPSRRRAYENAVQNGIQVAFSAISFERWILIHFARSTKVFDSTSLILREVKNYFPSYDKASNPIFPKLKERLPVAIKNAQWLRSQHLPEVHFTESLVWTNVDVLVKELTDLSS